MAMNMRAGGVRLYGTAAIEAVAARMSPEDKDAFWGAMRDFRHAEYTIQQAKKDRSRARAKVRRLVAKYVRESDDNSPKLISPYE